MYKKFFAAYCSAILLSGCSSLPDVILKDRIANESKPLVKDGVQIVKPEHAKQYVDPAWPSPIQVVPPSKDGSILDGDYQISLFGGPGSGGRIDVVYVVDGDEGECVAAFEQLGYPDKEVSTVIQVGEGGGSYVRCGSTLIESDSRDLTFRHPFISQHYYVELISQENLDRRAFRKTARMYPIKIRYIKSATADEL